jgi:hypothetical protein
LTTRALLFFRWCLLLFDQVCDGKMEWMQGGMDRPIARNRPAHLAIYPPTPKRGRCFGTRCGRWTTCCSPATAASTSRAPSSSSVRASFGRFSLYAKHVLNVMRRAHVYVHTLDFNRRLPHGLDVAAPHAGAGRGGAFLGPKEEKRGIDQVSHIPQKN